MIQEAYVSLEVAKLLKEKGFDIPVNYEYHYTITIPQFHKKKHNFNGIEYCNCSSEWYSAPTHQMAMAWLREVHSIFILIEYDSPTFSADVYRMNELDEYGSAKHIPPTFANCKTYEQACEAALKYSLENLI